MHRLLSATQALFEERPQLSPSAAKHLRVLRPKDGEEIELFDGKGSKRTFRYDAAEKCLASEAGRGVAAIPRPLPLTLFACVTKGARWDWTVEKATELGATRIVPVVSERTIVRIPAAERAAKQERWTRIAEEAARQSDAAWLPEIAKPADFASALALAAETDCFAGALVTPEPPPLAAAIASSRLDAPGGVAVFVGPEGDFSPAELDALLNVARPASFGPTVLRAETAAIFALSVAAAISRTRRPNMV